MGGGGSGYWGTYLEEPVERDPEEEDVSEELDQSKGAVHHPVDQPLCVIVFVCAFNGFYSENIKQKDEHFAISENAFAEREPFINTSIFMSVQILNSTHIPCIQSE